MGKFLNCEYLKQKFNKQKCAGFCILTMSLLVKLQNIPHLLVTGAYNM